jgi:hypothetical protein
VITALPASPEVNELGFKITKKVKESVKECLPK